LGRAVCRRLTSSGVQHKGVDAADFDLTDEKATMAAILDYAPDSVIHCAAYTAVDKAEPERERCLQVNVNGTAHVAKACRELDARMLYISTDYVFDGTGDIPFETHDPKSPINYYGKTKDHGEEEVLSRLPQSFIVRISWLFGLDGNNFVKTMLCLGAEQDSIRVVADQVGSPTYAEDVAQLMCQMIQTDKYGIYHATNEGFCSWYDFASAIISLAKLECQVVPIPTSAYPTPARRPMNSRLSKKSLDENGFEHLPNWEDALTRYLASVR
jgi:dTDP-4-dehydrorhamnose reductase